MKHYMRSCLPILLTACLCQLLLPGMAQEFSQTIKVTGIEGGQFSVTAIVAPSADTRQKAALQPDNKQTNSGNVAAGNSANTKQPAASQPTTGNTAANQNANKPSAAVPTENTAQAAAMQAQLDKISQRISAQLKAQQDQLVSRMNQLQQAQNRTAQSINAQQQQITNLNATQRAQTAAIQAAQRQLTAQQDLARQLFLQTQRDRMLRNFEQALLNNGFMNNGLGNLGPNGGNDLLSLIRQLLNGQQPDDQNMASQFRGRSNRSQNAEQTRRRLADLLAGKLSDDAANKVLSALNKSMDARQDDDLDQFTSLNKKLDADAEKMDLDDYEQLAKFSETFGKTDKKVAREFLELSMEAAARTSTDFDINDDKRKKAREFTVELTLKFGELKKRFDAPSESEIRKNIDFDVEKCMRIASGKDIYATTASVSE